MDWAHVLLAAALAGNAIGWAFSVNRTNARLAEMDLALTRIEGTIARLNQR